MLRKMFLLASSLLVSIIVFSQRLAQNVISPAGDIGKTGKVYIEWTLGEPFVETITTKNQLFTQGFHQPMIAVLNQHSPRGTSLEQLKITISPNPAESILKTIIQRESNTRLYVELSDMYGHLLSSKISNAKFDVLDFNLVSYASGTYMLTVRNAKGNLYRTFKIIKAQ